MKNLLYLFVFLLFACAPDAEQKKTTTAQASKETVFRQVPTSESGLNFYNNVRETNQHNYFKFQYTYNGGGCAVGDINKDGLLDIYLTGNQVNDALFLNKGDLKFENITNSAGISNAGKGFTFGVSMVDIDQDGDEDIYVCRSGTAADGEQRRNLLYINNGDLTFTEKAKQFGLDDIGHSIMSAFFDYDKDGDLDMYLTNHPVAFGQNLKERLANMENPSYEVSDHLYENNGNGKFTEVSKKAGINNYGHGLGLLIWDINEDGWDDIYVANDYQSPDYVYINQKNGTFEDRMTDYFEHIPYYSMGADIGDIDNDGDLDLYVVEMLPEDRRRRTMNLTHIEESSYYIFRQVGFHEQAMHNVLSINNGNGTFSDIAKMTETHATDWSWSTNIEDLDNDGDQDIFVTNGFLRDMQDKDYIKRGKMMAQRGKRITLSQLDSISQSVKLSNFLFENQGDLHFEKRTMEWGLGKAAFSAASVPADLDNDGDLDLIVSNTNLQLAKDPVFLYENKSSNGKNFIQFELKGPSGNERALGAVVEIEGGFGKQKKEMRRCRGYQSYGPGIIHFGVEAGTKLDVRVTWPEGKVSYLDNIEAGQRLIISDISPASALSEEVTDKRFEEISGTGISFVHQDILLQEYETEAGLPLRMSMQGPASCVGDVDGNGFKDLFIAGGAGQSGALFLNDGTKFKESNGPWSAHSAKEGTAAEFIDLDSDGDLDLIIGNGSIEFAAEPTKLADDVYLNDGSGRFTWEPSALPTMYSNTSCIAAGDIDGDGDLDLFIGSRSVPLKYGEIPFSFLLINENGRFTSKGAQLAQGLLKCGMVTDAQWSDLNADGLDDLIVCGDWMSVKVFLNEGGQLVEQTDRMGDFSSGSWNCLKVCDVNSDGSPDIIAGNDGLNQLYQVDETTPMYMYRGAIGKNGGEEVLITESSSGKELAVRSFNHLRTQFPQLKEQYAWYAQFASHDIESVFGQKLKECQKSKIETLSSGVYLSSESGFEFLEFPRNAQLSSINEIGISKSGHLILAGNEDYLPVEIGNLDGGTGHVLKWNGSGFEVIDSHGLGLKGVCRDIEMIEMKEATNWIFVRNKASVGQFRESTAH